jgi:hypothetical protein
LEPGDFAGFFMGAPVIALHHMAGTPTKKKAAEAAFLAVIPESIKDYRGTTFSA